MIEPAILDFGMPVILTSTVNEDGSPNLAPISCVWWLGWSCVVGYDASSTTTKNLERNRECVMNLPSADLVNAVDRLAGLTGSNPVPEHKRNMGYRYEPNKFEVSGLTPMASDLVKVPRVKECPVQLEAVVENIKPFGENDSKRPFVALAVEVRIVRIHVHEAIVDSDNANHIDPDKWWPLITNFRQFFGLGPTLHQSEAGYLPEETLPTGVPLATQ